MICPKCNTESGPSLFCYVCDTYLPSVSAGVKATIPSRLGAYLLDVLVFLTLLIAIWALAVAIGVNIGSFYRSYGLVAFLLVLFGGGLAYFLFSLWLLARGQTPGKWFMDIRGVDKRDGSQPGLARMLLRETLGKWASGFFLGLGWFWAIWDRDAQAWHDKTAGTVILYKRSQSRKLLAFGLLCSALVLCIGFSERRLAEALRQQEGVANQHVFPATASPEAASGFIPASVLGFHFRQSAHDMGERAGALGFRLIDCQQRSADAPEYVDCKLLRGNGDSLTASFLKGKLQRLELSFRIDNYDQVLQEIERDHGAPRISESGPLQGTAEWGSAAEGFNISLGKTADTTQGWLETVEITLPK